MDDLSIRRKVGLLFLISGRKYEHHLQKKERSSPMTMPGKHCLGLVRQYFVILQCIYPIRHYRDMANVVVRSL